MSRFEIAPWLRYDCIGCGDCCRRGFNIWCPAGDYPRLAAVDWAGRFPELAGKRLFLPQARGYRFNLDESGACLFLDGENRCRMHAALGFERKVLTCKMYPFNLVHSCGRVYVGLLFSCPAVVDGRGRPVAAQTGLQERLLAEMDGLFGRPRYSDTVALDGRREVTCRNLRFLEQALLEALEADLPLLRRLLWAADMLDRLERTGDADLEPGGFLPTMQHHRDRARENAENRGLSRPRLGFFERLLLREFQGFSTSLAERGLTSASAGVRARARLKRAGLALRYFYGRGAIPAPEGETGFAAARAVECFHLPAASEELLSRYLRTRIAARMYFGSEGWGLPVLQGARLVRTRPAAVLWHAKVAAAAAGKQAVEHVHVRRALLLVDNAFGHMAGLHTGFSRRALSLVSRPGWTQKALLATVL